MKRKVCLLASFCCILFFMLAMHTIQRGTMNIVVPSDPMSTSTSPTTAQPLTTAKRAPNQENTCRCQTCVANKGKSEWFDQHFDIGQQPYLTNGDNKMDPDSLKWWMGLQRTPYEEPLEEVIRKMFTVISSPPSDWVPRQDRCRTCAVVGNSGNLLGSHFGEDINRHSTVIRMNKAITQGYETDVGNRTTHHIMYPESAVDLPPTVHLVLLPFKQLDLKWLTSALSTGEISRTYMQVKSRVRADKDKVMVVNPTFFKYTHESWNEKHGRYPSTGMLAIIFALHLCDEVSVFGYGADEQGNWHHYWEKNRHGGAFRKTGVHNADFETEVIHKLHEAGKIRLYKR